MNQLQDAIENIIPRGASSGGGGGDQPRQNVLFNSSSSSSSNAFDIGDPYIESMVVQRNNLMLLLKLVIKGLFRHRSKLVMTAECRTYFEHLFVLLEKCLQHGLKQRKQMFSVKTDIWNVIELTGKTLSSSPNEASEMLESVRHLPKLRSPTARARAWLRLAMMKKKLPECLQSLLDHRESLLVELYEPWALLMTEEANLLAGLLVGLNSFDYTVYLKGDDSVLTAFEHEPVIDLQYYLQDPYGAADVQVFSGKQQQQQQMTNGEQLNNSENGNGNGSKDEVDREEMATAAAAAAPNVEVLLEQNSYVEEINKHLKATIKTLEEKIETLLERRSGSVSSSSNDGHNSNQPQPPHSSSSARSLMEFGTALVAKEKQIMEEERRRREAEKRLEMEAKLREESETARNCLERDIQEKQETIVTLRAQLDEVKAINITMFSRLQEREREAKERARRTTELETLVGQQKKEIGQLEKRCAQLSESLDSGGNHNDHSCDSSGNGGNGNGKDELLASYQKLIDEQQEQMTVLQLEVEELGTKATFSAHLKEAYSLLKKKFDENELALEEIGKQLQDSKLEIESLKEYNGHLKEAAWAKDSEAARCRQCEREFTLARRKHHCRSCGEIFCAGCSNNEMPLPSSKKPVRVCDACHAFLLERYSAHSSTST